MRRRPRPFPYYSKNFLSVKKFKVDENFLLHFGNKTENFGVTPLLLENILSVEEFVDSLFFWDFLKNFLSVKKNFA